MSTRSRIGILHEDGTTETIFCYWSSYPERQIPILTNYYDTTDKVKELLALGDISILRKRVAPDTDEPVNSVDHPADVMIAYCRDCWSTNKTMSPAITHKCINSLVRSCLYIEYLYLFDEKTGRWMQPIKTEHSRSLKHC